MVRQGHRRPNRLGVGPYLRASLNHFDVDSGRSLANSNENRLKLHHKDWKTQPQAKTADHVDFAPMLADSLRSQQAEQGEKLELLAGRGWGFVNAGNTNTHAANKRK